MKTVGLYAKIRRKKKTGAAYAKMKRLKALSGKPQADSRGAVSTSE